MSLCDKLIRELHGAFVGGELNLDKFTRIVARYAAKPRKPVKKFSGKGSRVGKLGIVRKVGKDMTELREQAYDRAHGHCEVALPHSCPGSVAWELGDLAHIRNRRMYGDVLSNVWWACREGHRVAMHNPKPCPRKERA